MLQADSKGQGQNSYKFGEKGPLPDSEGFSLSFIGQNWTIGLLSPSLQQISNSQISTIGSEHGERFLFTKIKNSLCREKVGL